MSVGEYLPPVVTRLSMNMDDFAAKVAEAKAMIKSIGSDANVNLNIRTDGLAKAAAEMAALAKATRAASTTNADAAKTEYLLAMAERMRANTARDAANATRDSGNAAAFAALGWGALGRNFELWAGAFGSTALIGKVAGWHIALDGIMEAAFALAPALIDLAAGLMAMAPAGQDIYTHLKAVQAVSSALGQDIPPLTGKFSDLAQAMAPQAVEAYGGVLNLVNGRLSGLTPIIRQVVTGIDDWVARLDLFMGRQNGVNAVLQHGVGFLTQFRQVVDNVGVAFMNLIKSDPGTAHFLMDVVVGASRLLGVITSLPTPILMSALALHSIDIWGGLAVSAVKNLANGFVSLAANAGKFLETTLPALMANPLFWVAAAAAGVAYLGYEMTQASASAKAFIGSLTQQVGQDSASRAILDINSAIGKLNQQIQFQQSAGGIRQLEASWAKLRNTGQSLGADTQAVGNDFARAFNQMTGGHIISGLAALGRGLEGIFVPGQGAAVVAKNNIEAYRGAIVSLTGEQGRLFNETGGLIRQGYTYAQALALEDLAGVKAGDSVALMGQKVANLITGYQNMSVRAGLLANSVNAVTLTAEMQSSQIQALTQGWTAFISLVTGGTSGFLTFATQMAGLYASASGAADKLSVSNGKASISITGLGASAKGTTASMTGLNNVSLQLRQSFTQGITNASQLMNSLYQMASAAGLGAKGTDMLTQAGRDMVAELLPMAKRSSEATAELYALAQQAGYTGADSFQQLAQWVGNLHNPMANLDSIVGKLTVDSASLASDVKNLANAVNQNLNQAMAAAIFQATGGQAAFDQFATAVLRAHGNVGQMQGSAGRLAQQLLTVMGNTHQAHAEFDAFGMMLGLTRQQADKLWASVVRLGQSISNLHDKTVTITVDTVATGTSVGGGGGQRITHHAAGTPSAPPGWAWVGEAGPELVKFRGGETVVPNHVATGYAGGTGDDHSHPIVINLDGRQVYSSMQQRSVATQRRTGHSGLSKRTR